MTETKPEWDPAVAETIVGKTVMIGMTYVDDEGVVLRRVQMHGVIGLADPEDGLRIDLSGVQAGQVYWLPPDLTNFSQAQPGVYRLKETAEEIVDPDLLSTWTIRSPAEAPNSD